MAQKPRVNTDARDVIERSDIVLAAEALGLK